MAGSDHLVFQVPVGGKGMARLFLPETPLTNKELQWIGKGIAMVLENLTEQPDWSAFGLPVCGTRSLL